MKTIRRPVEVLLPRALAERDYPEDEDHLNSDYDEDNPPSGRSSPPSSPRGEHFCALDGDTSPAGDGVQHLPRASDGDTSPAGDGVQHLPGHQSPPLDALVPIAVHGSDSDENSDSEGLAAPREVDAPVPHGAAKTSPAPQGPVKRLFTSIESDSANKEKDLKLPNSNAIAASPAVPTKEKESLERLRNQVDLDAHEHRQQMLSMQAMITSLQEKLLGKVLPEPSFAHDRLKDPAYAERFQILVKTGYNMDEVHNAL
jgi:hypothetical protein